MDWQNMFRRYADLVGNYEGVFFLYEYDWTPEEWTAIKTCLEETR